MWLHGGRNGGNKVTESAAEQAEALEMLETKEQTSPDGGKVLLTTFVDLVLPSLDATTLLPMRLRACIRHSQLYTF